MITDDETGGTAVHRSPVSPGPAGRIFRIAPPRCVRWAILLASVAAGCGYSVGFKAREGIRSVSIPVFENRSLRRELEFALTEAVVREVQRRTPLIVTSPDRADLTLRGTIESFQEAVLVEGESDVVLESSAVVTVGVQASDRRGRRLFAYTDGASDATGPALREAAQFARARGEGIGRPTSEVFRNLAERIVMLLEERMSPAAATRTSQPGRSSK